MDIFTNNYYALSLPLLGTALMVALSLTWLLRQYTQDITVLRITFGVIFFVCCLPMGGLAPAQYLRVIIGDLSIVSIVTLGSIAAFRLVENEWRFPFIPSWLAVMIIAVALLLYPTALGLTMFDLYAHGYYPIVIAPALLAVFVFSLWFDSRPVALILATAFVAWAFSMLNSNNLWDYLIDPVIVIYSIGHLIHTRCNHIRFGLPPLKDGVEFALVVFAASFVTFAIFLADSNPDNFRHVFTVEDGFIEWCTVLVLLWAMTVCARRVWILRHVRSPLFLGVTALLGLFCLFGAGEEISWGQRLLGLETPEYLREINSQGEIGLHNIVVEIDGEPVKINKLVFGTGLAIAMALYLFVVTPLYRTKPQISRLLHKIGAPMPRNYQMMGYLLVVATVELFVDSSKRGEMTELAGAIIFALNIAYPYNPWIFSPSYPASQQPKGMKEDD